MRAAPRSRPTLTVRSRADDDRGPVPGQRWARARAGRAATAACRAAHRIDDRQPVEGGRLHRRRWGTSWHGPRHRAAGRRARHPRATPRFGRGTRLPRASRSLRLRGSERPGQRSRRSARGSAPPRRAAVRGARRCTGVVLREPCGARSQPSMLRMMATSSGVKRSTSAATSAARARTPSRAERFRRRRVDVEGCGGVVARSCIGIFGSPQAARAPQELRTEGGRGALRMARRPRFAKRARPRPRS